MSTLRKGDSIMPAGRPPELDSNGNAIAKCLVNVTIPTKLRDFLRQHNINRSELFRTAALKLKNLEICPHCYSHDILAPPHNLKGHSCNDCGKWLKFKRCDLCEALHTPTSKAAPVNGKVGCDLCPEYLQQVEENKKINVVFGNDL